MLTRPPVAVFAMPERGHFNRLRPLISGLADADVAAYVFTDQRFKEEVQAAGGRFVDLFAGHPIEGADATSIPVPCRYVSFAGHYADQVVRQVAPLRPGLVIHDTFAVIGVVVANHLGVPRVNVCSGHNFAPAPTEESLGRPHVHVSEECWHAVRALRERHGLSEATPFSFVSTLSPDLNVYCEPPEFLRVEERQAFEPIVFFGSLPASRRDEGTVRASPFGDGAGRKLRIYASFGTVVWRYYEAEALSALEAFGEAVAGVSDAVALVSLGGAASRDRAARLARRNVRVENYVDQWNVLREALFFLTHHGLNSTHEAIFHQTPMISYPFLSDQPALAKRCQELGLAVPLVEALRGPVAPRDVGSALDRVAAQRGDLQARLAEARCWELETIRGRKAVIERIIDLAR